MKKYLSILLSVLLLTALLCTTAYASDIYDQGYFKYRLEDGGVTIVLYFGNESVVEVPNQISGTPVSKIAAGAFTNCPEVTQVILPDTIMEVEAGAFGSGISVDYSRVFSFEGTEEELPAEDPTIPSEPVVLPGGTVDVTDQVVSEEFADFDLDDPEKNEETPAPEESDTAGESAETAPAEAAPQEGGPREGSDTTENTDSEAEKPAEAASSVVWPVVLVIVLALAAAIAVILLLRRKKQKD